MTAMSTIANFNGQKPIIDPNNAALLLIDHQSGLFQTIGDMPMPVLRTLGTRPWFEGRLMVSRAQSVFDAEGNLTDETTRQRLAQFIAGFAAFAAGR
jgi:hypothetical protein